jgi:hypothetical protein
MYPDVWTVPEDRRPQTPGLRPRRRARKEHSVVPVILNADPPPKAEEPAPNAPAV